MTTTTSPLGQSILQACYSEEKEIDKFNYCKTQNEGKQFFCEQCYQKAIATGKDKEIVIEEHIILLPVLASDTECSENCRASCCRGADCRRKAGTNVREFQHAQGCSFLADLNDIRECF